MSDDYTIRTYMGTAAPRLRRLADRQDDWYEVTGGGLTAPVMLRLGRAADGRLVCTGLVLGHDVPVDGPPPEITTRSLRISLASIVQTIARRAENRASTNPMDKLGRFVIDRTKPAGPPRVRPGRQGHGAEFYEEVTAAYRRALRQHPEAPTKALAANYPGWSEAAVRYWLRVARDRGLLGRSERGMAGEGGTP